MIKASYKTEIVSSNRIIFRKELISSVYFHNRGNTDVIVMDNVLLAPGANFIWENPPLSREVVLIDNDIPVVFIPSETESDNQLLVIKIMYHL